MSTDQPSRQAIIEHLASVKNVGEFRAQKLYEELNVRTIDELVELAKQGELQKNISGIGAATEKKILSAALDLQQSSDAVDEVTPEQDDSDNEEVKAQDDAPAEDVVEEEVEEDEVEAPAEDTVIIASSDPEQAPDEVASLDPVKAVQSESAEDDDDEPEEASSAPLLHQVLVCPNCGNDSFISEPGAGITCTACRREYVERHGVIDMIPPYKQPHSPSQRVMESRFYARFYEDVMRPRLTSLVTSRTMREEYALSTDLLELTPSSRILDVACGTANFTRYFARRIDAMEQHDAHTALLVGFDLSAPMLEVARQHISKEDLRQPICLVRGDASRLPFEKGSFDRLHCAAALHLMEDPDEALRHFANVLEKDGVLVITTFVKGKGILRRIAKRLAEIPTKFKWFKEDDLNQRIERAGFEVLESHVEDDAITIKAIKR